MSILQSLAIRKKITAIFRDGTSKQNLVFRPRSNYSRTSKTFPFTVSGDEPSASELLRELAAQANRKITSAENGLVLTLPVTEPSAVEPVNLPIPRTRRGDLSASQEPKAERKYKNLSSIFFYGSVKGQINSVFKTRITNPQKVLDYRAALASGDCSLGTKPLTKSLRVKLTELNIDPAGE
jgi:hypothetical protein